MKRILCSLIVIVTMSGLAGLAHAQQMEVDRDRPGGDYTNVTLPAGSQPQSCQQLCAADGQCKSWTYVKAGIQAQNPRCWLKSSVPAAVANTCCVSGLKPADAAFEPNSDRPGGDYMNMNFPSNWGAEACQALCKANGTCKAWTWVKAGVQGANPRCWLKQSVPPKIASNCCTSGVK